MQTDASNERDYVFLVFHDGVGSGIEERADGHREVGRSAVALVELAQSFK